MKCLEIGKRKTGVEENKKSSAEIYQALIVQGACFSYKKELFHTLGVDEDKNIYFCKKGSTKLDINSFDLNAFLTAIENGKIKEEDDEYTVVDEDLLVGDELEEYTKLKDAMNEIIKTYGPSYSYIVSKTNKDHLKALAENAGMPYDKFRRTLTRFLTHGLKSYALLSKRSVVFDSKRKRPDGYNYTKKTGRKPIKQNGLIVNQGVPITDEIKEDFKPFVDMVRGGLPVTKAFNRYNLTHHLRDENDGGFGVLVDVDKRPTLNQFRHYVNNCLDRKAKLIGSKGSIDYYNNHRVITSDTVYGASHPGDIVEIDAWEADVSLLMRGTSDVVISRPTLYLMVDRFTRLICAFSIGYEVNSYIGLSSLFMNLAEEKSEILKRYKLEKDESMVSLPAPFIPNTVVTDNGSDFKSIAFNKFVTSMGISHQIAPPGAGSAKGLVERTFGELAMDHKDILKGAGLITKEYNSDHHKKACLDLDSYVKLIITAIIKHNFHAMGTYPTKDMELLEENFVLSPKNIWDYYTEKKLMRPRSISDKSTFLFNLMERVKVSINRNGIIYKGLYYSSSSDYSLQALQERDKTNHMDFRIDPRNVDRLYYLKDGVLSWCPINPNKSSNLKYMGISFKEYEELKQKEKDKIREGKEFNEHLQAASTMISDSIVNEAKSKQKTESFEKNDMESIRRNRKEEKLKRAYENRIATKLEDDDALPSEEIKPLDEPHYLEGIDNYEDLMAEMEDCI